MTPQNEYWRLCSSCKKPIAFKSKYFECSVSSCQGKRTGYVFCTVSCWERHLPGAKHRDAGAVEKMAPSFQEALIAESQVQEGSSSSTAPTREVRLIRNTGTGVSNAQLASSKMEVTSEDVLVVVSKLKAYIKDKSDMNTSGDVADVLSHMIRRVCDDAIINAQRDGRKTVMARDFN